MGGGEGLNRSVCTTHLDPLQLLIVIHHKEAKPSSFQNVI